MKQIIYLAKQFRDQGYYNFEIIKTYQINNELICIINVDIPFAVAGQLSQKLYSTVTVNTLAEHELRVKFYAFLNEMDEIIDDNLSLKSLSTYYDEFSDPVKLVTSANKIPELYSLSNTSIHELKQEKSSFGVVKESEYDLNLVGESLDLDGYSTLPLVEESIPCTTLYKAPKFSHDVIYKLMDNFFHKHNIVISYPDNDSISQPLVKGVQTKPQFQSFWDRTLMHVTKYANETIKTCPSYRTTPQDLFVAKLTGYASSGTSTNPNSFFGTYSLLTSGQNPRSSALMITNATGIKP